MTRILIILCLTFLGFVGCAHRPLEELSLADLALKSAQKNRADGFVPELYRRAENFYLRAKKDFVDGYFDSAKKFADQARRTAEQAEYQALLKQNQAKDKIISPTGAGQPAPESTPLPNDVP